MISKPQQYIAGALALVVLLTLSYCRGLEKGKTDERLETNRREIVSNDSATKMVTRGADSARRETDKGEVVYRGIRDKVRVVHDTVTVLASDGNTDGKVYVDSTLARLITSADSLIVAQKRLLSLQDTLVASLRTGITLRDTRIKLLESRSNPRISKGVQVGVGYCQNATGRTPCAYLGVGLQVRL